MSSTALATALVVPFEQLRMTDVESVGGKNASLGEMISQLAASGVRVPGGFATTAHAFREFLKHGGLVEKINEKLSSLNTDDVRALAEAGAQIRQWVIDTPFPPALEQAIRSEFEKLTAGNPGASFAVRSSATAEDLPDASFAGQQETFLNVVGIEDVLHKIKEVFASLYNDRAISYRVHKGFAHSEVALSAGVQRMVRSDLGAAGVMFTIDTESGFKDVVFITSSYGLGETVVQGAVNPDEFYVHKPALKNGKFPIIRRNLGSKLIKMEFATPQEKAASGKLVKTVDTPPEQRNRYSLTDADVVELARYALIIEEHYGRPMDIEWGKDGGDGQLYILQARPETVKSQADGKVEQRYKLKGQGTVLAEGRAIGQKIGTGRVRIVHSISEMDKVQPGDVLVTDMTDPNWEPVMKKASAIVTNRGGRTCHAAIIARELGIPAVVGCGNATEVLKDGALVTVACSEGDTGYIYDGLLETEITEVRRGEMPYCPVKIMMNVGNPQLAFDFAQMPNAGVGLARLEFIINNNIGVHPKAILDYPNVDSELKKAVESVARGHASPRAFYVDKLAEGIATIAAAFWPKPVIVRLSDFKSNEYRKLIGGSRYEPEEENPMLGFRGASRYISEEFAEAFAMECEAIKRVRNDMGLDNVEIMVPFVRTLKQAERVTQLLAEHGLQRGKDNLRVIMMCEVPSNAILAEQFLEYFDGMSIGSNDLTQLTLGLDRDSGLELLAHDFDERDAAVKALISRAIAACRAVGKYVGICGQGPSDHPDFAEWLAQEGIVSISLNPDTVIDTWQRLAERK
ncbi:phosphoenolpyruvate synthase [Caldimonas thermodepolymerans]|jgi:phosphoenolpyruvate synthase|uniref:Phosphoenolpyruvate synthase n=1 Tax=Caldimonas thermodepolymerans TaxID=215580 RepID=A0A2S5T1M7_9BURK|nr:phosphoenolpyruvate synthase [Caldimonas thermodepolymerans]PPE68925.1 phosphoenolpyruvate synthase [Caldimonas thermodepolymerans]QPC30101.1 phosphoenolpyruvate synthase [Caldimonas thermodepolymerans]RDI00477.1 phosphoenolpyruvate synthase [Caldimonas thermodepolymerans]TCP07244.1 phosphoenolpyruvate synthase [Caldimonas thermodepolymerans]UZG42854.1 phosphoenolpyruvate synthase [Caldimonas thermodepolymerans]